MDKPKRGQPPKPPHKRRSAVKLLRVNKSEAEAIAEAAEAAGKPEATWMRETLLRAAKRRRKSA